MTVGSRVLLKEKKIATFVENVLLNENVEVKEFISLISQKCSFRAFECIS